jgi:hypothetical protein
LLKGDNDGWFSVHLDSLGYQTCSLGEAMVVQSASSMSLCMLASEVVPPTSSELGGLNRASVV